jgi:nucleoside-diphosphate-sugar epimerase
LFNLGTGHAVSFREVAELIAKKYSCSVKEIEFPKELEGQYQLYTRADTTKLRNIVGNYKFISVEDFLS